MDFTKILSAFAAIENKQTLTEAEKKETTWTDMKGNKHPATQVKGEKYTGKEAEKDEKDKEVKESVGYKPVDLASLIARMDAIVESADADEDGEDDGDADDVKEEVAEAKSKKAKKDYDKDGKIESEKDEVIGSRRKAAGLDESEDRPASKEKEGTWTDKSGKKHPSKEVQGWQSQKADKEADKEKKSTMKESQLDECGDMMGGMAGGEDQSGMNVNTSIDTRTGRKTVSISADGQAADELMQMLKLAGMSGMGGEEGGMSSQEGEQEGEVEVELVPLAHAEGGFKAGGEEEGEVEENYANEPNPKMQSVDQQMHQGTDLNREKAMTKHGYKQGDNPLAMREARELAALEAELMEELNSIKVKKAK